MFNRGRRLLASVAGVASGRRHAAIVRVGGVTCRPLQSGRALEFRSGNCGSHLVFRFNFLHEFHEVREMIPEIRCTDCSNAGNPIARNGDPFTWKSLPEKIWADPLPATTDSTSVAYPNRSVLVFRQDTLDSGAHTTKREIYFTDDRV